MSEILYKLDNIKQFYNGRKVLDIPSLDIYENQVIGFLGPNGSGKSTLFSILSLINEKFEGTLKYKGISSNKLSLKDRQDIVFVPQNPYLLKRTVYENVAYGLKIRNETKNLDNKVKEALALVGFNSSFIYRKWNQLSGGEAQRVALAARLILSPKVLILDEPTSGIDVNSAQRIKKAILTANRKYKTSILVSSHDYSWLNHICNKKIALFQGNIVQNSGINLLFAPWDKGEDMNLVKYFVNDQKLVIENSVDKKRDSIAMINSKDIYIFKDKKSPTSLKGIVNSIHQMNSKNDLIVEFSIGGINFSSQTTKEYMQAQAFLPGDLVDIEIDTKNICWI